MQRLLQETARLEARKTEEVKKAAASVAVLREQTRQSNIDLRNSAKESLATANSVEALRVQISQLAKTWATLDVDSKEFKETGQQLAELRAQVTAAEMSVGQFGRNVGNYASGFSPLNFQVQQLARELPSLAHSLPQFFLAISNNLPMFTDEVSKAQKAYTAYKAALAQGIDAPKVVSPMKQLVSSIFSWQTALIVGITLIVAFGKNIAEWGRNLFKSKDAAIDFAGAIREINKAAGEDKSIGESIANYEKLQRIFTTLGDDAVAKKGFIQDYREELDKTGLAINDINTAEQFFSNEGEAAFRQTVQNRARVLAGMQLASEKYQEALKEEQALNEQPVSIRGGVSIIEARAAAEIERNTEFRNIEEGVNTELALKRIGYLDAEIARYDKIIGRVKTINEQGDAYINLVSGIEENTTGIPLLSNTNTGIDTTTNTETDRELERRRKFYADMAAEERKGRQELEKIDIEASAKLARESVDNDNLSYQTRLDALNAHIEARRKLLTDAAKNQEENLIQGTIDRAAGVGITMTRVEAEQQNANQIEAIHAVLNQSLYDLDVNYQKQIEGLIKTETQRRVEEYKIQTEARQQSLDDMEAAELAAASVRYRDGNTKERDYEAEKLEITRRYAKLRAEAEMNALMEIVDTLDLEADLKEDYARRIADMQAQINRDRLEQEADDNERARKKEEQKRRETLRTVEDIVGGFLDITNEIFTASTERRLANIDIQLEAAQKATEEEIAQIDRLYEHGAISEEQANARKAKATQEQAALEARMDAQRAQIAKRQARLQVLLSTAQSIMQAAASGPWPYNLIPIAFATGLGVAQLAAVNAAQYAEGTPEGGHPGGLAWVGDGGRSELIVSNGRAYKTPDSPTLINLSKGAVVYPDYEKAMRDTAMLNASQPLRIIKSDGGKSTPYNDRNVLAEIRQTNRLSERTIRTIRQQGQRARFVDFKRTPLTKVI